MDLVESNSFEDHVHEYLSHYHPSEEDLISSIPHILAVSQAPITSSILGAFMLDNPRYGSNLWFSSRLQDVLIEGRQGQNVEHRTIWLPWSLD